MRASQSTENRSRRTRCPSGQAAASAGQRPAGPPLARRGMGSRWRGEAPAGVCVCKGAMWKVSVCVHDCGGTQKDMACRTRHGAGVRGSAQRPHVAPRPARGGGLQQPMVAAPACHPGPGRPGVAAVLRPACGQQGARPAARRGVGEASGSAGTAGCGEALAGCHRKRGFIFPYSFSHCMWWGEVSACMDNSSPFHF